MTTKRLLSFLYIVLSALSITIIFACSQAASYQTGYIKDIQVSPTIYTGSQVSITYDTNCDGEVSITYKSQSEGDSAYSPIAPSAAGDWRVKISIEDGARASGCEVEYDFTIQKANPDYSNLLSSSYGILRGSALSQVILPDGFDWEEPEKVITASANYTAIYTPDDIQNYNILTGIEIYVAVVQEYVAKPELGSSDFVYNQSEQSINIAGYDTTKIDLLTEKSTLSAMNAGEYCVVFALKDPDNYAWQGGSRGEFSLLWNILKADSDSYPSSISLSGTYSASKTLGDYSLSAYPGVYWYDDNIIPTCDVTEYSALYYQADDVKNYTPSEFFITLTLSKADPTISTPQNLIGRTGEKLSSITLPAGWSWDNADTQITDQENQSYPATYTPADTVNFNTIKKNLEITLSNSQYDFVITYKEGTENAYEIIEKDNGEYTVSFSAISADSAYSISGALEGNIVINVSENYEFKLEMNGVSVSSKYSSPITVISADKITLSAKSGTSNYCNDLRTSVVLNADSSTYSYSSAIYSEVDLDIQGKGSLNVTSLNNAGIHTKDDLSMKNLTLSVMSYDNAIKGNDSVDVESGTYQIISTAGNGIRTSNSTKKYNSNGTLKKIQGVVNIQSGTLNIYSALDGIDAAYNCEIGAENVEERPVLNIYTSNYSDYTQNTISVSDSNIYIKSSTANYKYSIYYYNSSSDYKWVNSSASQELNGYYYYPLAREKSYQNLKVYVYASSQTQGQGSNYYSLSDKITLTSNYDTIDIDSGFVWTNYPSSSQNSVDANYSFNFSGGGPGSMAGGGFSPTGPGQGGPGSSGNTNKSDSSARGIKAHNEIHIYDSKIYAKCYDDCIHTTWDTDNRRGSLLGDEDDSTDDYYGTGNITINAGELTLYSSDDAIHSPTNLTINGSAKIVITSSYEAIEANTITIDGDDVQIYAYATDDGINAAQKAGVNTTPCIYIRNGYVDIDVASGDTDTLDSNGNISITGGKTILKNRQSASSSNTGGLIDLDGTFTLSGSNTILVCLGTWCNEVSSSKFTSGTSSITQGNYSLKNSSGTELLAFSLPNGYISSGTYSGYKVYAFGTTCYLYKNQSRI